MKLILFAASVFLFSACSHLSRDLLLDRVTAEADYSHLSGNCGLYDSRGNLIFKEPGYLCVFYRNGDIVKYANGRLYKTDKDAKIAWEKTIELHHQLKQEIGTDNFLTFLSTFEIVNGKKYRFDSVARLNANGEVIASYSFRRYFEENPYSYSETKIKIGSELQEDAFEQTHVNSLFELRAKDAMGAEKTAAIIVNDLKTSKLYFFDPALTKVMKTVDLKGRATHSALQWSENEIAFYVNHHMTGEYGRVRQSYVEKYNVLTETFQEIWNNHNPELFSPGCSSIQKLSHDRLFVLHSNCPLGPSKNRNHSQMELVDLVAKKSQVVNLDKTDYPLTDGLLIDARSFLKSRGIIFEK